MQEMHVRSLGWEDPLEEEMATHSSIPAWKIPQTEETGLLSLGREYPLEEEMATHCSILAGKISWTEQPGDLQSMGSQRVGHD